jgi:hypothetical protein
MFTTNTPNNAKPRSASRDKKRSDGDAGPMEVKLLFVI